MIQSWLIRNGVLSGLALGACVIWARPAKAEVTLLEKDGYTFAADGRINTFVSLATGDDYPLATPNPNGPPHDVGAGAGVTGASGGTTQQVDSKNHYFNLRARNGFVGSVLGFSIKRNLTATTTAKAYIGLWGHAETFGRDRWFDHGKDVPGFDVREGYATFDGPWGTFTAGRALGLFGRISTEIDFLYGHNYGLGFPCGDEQGPTCGHIGTGVMFPGFGAGFLYSTPSLGGLKFHAGIYDPVHLLGGWNRSPFARPEAALTFERKVSATGMFKLGVEGMVQPIARGTFSPTDPNVQIDVKDNVWGVAGGGRFEAGPLRFGAAAFRGKGLGQYYALQNSPVVFRQDTYEIRSFTGLYAQMALVFGRVQLSAGAGQVSIDQLAADKVDVRASYAKNQRGLSAAVYYSATDNLVFGLDYFRFETNWYGAPAATWNDPATMTPGDYTITGMLPPEKQVVHFVNAGATFHW